MVRCRIISCPLKVFTKTQVPLRGTAWPHSRAREGPVCTHVHGLFIFHTVNSGAKQTTAQPGWSQCISRMVRLLTGKLPGNRALPRFPLGRPKIKGWLSGTLSVSSPQSCVNSLLSPPCLLTSQRSEESTTDSSKQVARKFSKKQLPSLNSGCVCIGRDR